MLTRLYQGTWHWNPPGYLISDMRGVSRPSSVKWTKVHRVSARSIGEPPQKICHRGLLDIQM